MGLRHTHAIMKSLQSTFYFGLLLSLVKGSPLSSSYRMGLGNVVNTKSFFNSSSLLFTAVDPIGDDGWNKALCSGDKLLKAMNANDHDAGQLMNPAQDSAESQFLGGAGKTLKLSK